MTGSAPVNGIPIKNLGNGTRSMLICQSKDETQEDLTDGGSFASANGAKKHPLSLSKSFWRFNLVICIVCIDTVSSYSWGNTNALFTSPKRRSIKATTTSISATRLQSMVDEESFDTAAASNRIITTKKGKEARVEYKDFWGSAISAIEDSQGAPCVPTLDPFWGTLPKAAYQCEADEIWDPKPTCRIALDLAPILTKNNDPASPHAIEMVQHYLESGFQTFHGATPQFIEKFHSQTPTNIIGKDSIHWVLHYKVPTKIQSMHSVRHDILDNLLEPMSACTDAIDTLVVQCK